MHPFLSERQMLITHSLPFDLYSYDMLQRIHIAILIVSVAVSTLLGVATAPLDLSASHMHEMHDDHDHDDLSADQGSIERAEVAAQSGLNGFQPDHFHGHNPSDHSHEVPSLASGGVRSLACVSKRWALPPNLLADFSVSFRLERPPKPVLFA